MQRRYFMALALMVVGPVAAGYAFVTWRAKDTYRYKLTLTLETPNGVKSASNVVEVKYIDLSRSFYQSVRGQALYLDLGPGLRPLIALLTARDPRFSGDERKIWRSFNPTLAIAKAYGVVTKNAGGIRAFMKLRGARQMDRSDLPTLVTLYNQDDPATVTLVDPFNLEGTLGVGVSFKSVQIELTDEPISTGLEKRLPWILRSNRPCFQCFQLDGAVTRHAGAALANELSIEDFYLRMP